MIDGEAFAEEFSRAIDKATVGNFIQQSISAYDQYANAAMNCMLGAVDWQRQNMLDFKVIAENSWAMADAMMEERKKRSLVSKE